MEQRPGEVIWMRPERAGVGRPAQHTRAEITAAAIAIADAEGLDGVSMRRVAAELGTGAASLYRYLDTREDLLDLMTDATGAEFSLTAPRGYWLAGLVDVGEQAREIMRRHRWLASLVITRSVLGPHGLALLEHVLILLARHPASLAAKLEAFAMLNTITALFVQNEMAGGSAVRQRNAAFLSYAVASGDHPRLADLLSSDPPGPEPPDPYRDILVRVLTGLLTPAPPHT